MRIADDACFACEERRPVATRATLGDGRTLHLCQRCLQDRECRTQFVAAYLAHRRASTLAEGYARQLKAAMWLPASGVRAQVSADASSPSAVALSDQGLANESPDGDFEPMATASITDGGVQVLVASSPTQRPIRYLLDSSNTP